MSESSSADEVQASFRVEALPGVVVLTLQGDAEGTDSSFVFSVPMPVKDAIDLVAMLSDGLAEATERFDWSEMEFNGE